MTAQRPGITRRSSVVRDAFARAAEGHKTPVALDTWPVFAGGAALGKLDRALAAEGDLNPPWQLLDAIASANPGPLLEVLCEPYGPSGGGRRGERKGDPSQEGQRQASQAARPRPAHEDADHEPAESAALVTAAQAAKGEAARA